MTTTILLITHDLGAGGVQRKIADVARCLTTSDLAAGTSCVLLLEESPPRDSGERALFDTVASSVMRIRWRSWPNERRPLLPFGLFCFWQVLILRPSRIIGLLRGPGILAVILRQLFWWRTIRVGISDDSYPSGAIAEQTRGATHAAVLRWLVRLAYGNADWIAAPSDAASTDLVLNFSVPADRVIVSRNWVSAAVSEAVRAEDSGSHGALTDVPERGFDLIYVGRLAPVKNLALFVEIVRDVRDVIPSVRAVIVGGGSALAQLERQRAECGLDDHLVFAGWQADVAPWLRASKLFCLTSHHEGLPIAALEAMTLGVPVIASRYPGADEIVHDGETGFLCRDRSEFVDRIVRCLTQEPLRQELGRRGRELADARYGPANLQAFAELIVRG